MSKFSIAPENLKAPIRQFGESYKNLNHFAFEIEQVKNSLDPSLRGVAPSLDFVKGSVKTHALDIQTIGVSLGSIIQLYQDCDQNITNNHNSTKNYSNMAVTYNGPGGGASTGTTYDPNDPAYKAWEALPEELKDIIKPEDIMVGDDGFVVIKTSLTELLERAGADSSVKDKFKAYDDWYIMGIPDENGNIIYSMFKYREVTDGQDGKGMRVPFIAMDMDTFAGFFGDNSNITADQLQTAVDKCVYAESHIKEYDKTILEYFKDPNSDGSYVMADFLAEKAAEQLPFDANNQYTIPYAYDKFNKNCRNALDELAQAGIYDKDTNTIKIDSSDGLSEDEKRALLIITTGDPDKYAYAAENQYHADKFKEGSAWMGKWSRTNESAIASDAGVGESFWGWTYEGSFKSPDGKYYQEQIQAHGEN